MNKPVKTNDCCGLFFALVGDTGGRKQGRKTRVDEQVQQSEFMQYPRRRLSPGVLRFITGRLIDTLGNLHLNGVEHLPTEGPVILAANHFNFVDPALVLYARPRAVEFIGGANRPNSPLWAQMFPSSGVLSAPIAVALAVPPPGSP